MDEIKKIEPEEVIITETHSSAEPMRQPDFKCEKEETEKFYRDFFNTTSFRRVALSAAIIFACCAIVLALSLIFNHKVDLISLILIGVYFVLITVMMFVVYRSSVKKTLERVKYANGGKFPPLNEYFFADEIVTVNEDPDKTKEFSYEDIKSVSETSLQYLIELKLKMFLLAPKDIESASGEAFDKYILEKATGLKKKKIGKARKYRVIFDIFFVLTALAAVAALVLFFVL